MRRVIAFFGICGMVLGFLIIKSRDDAFSPADWIGLCVGSILPVLFLGIAVRRSKRDGEFLFLSTMEWVAGATVSYALGIGLGVYIANGLRGG
jgi:hypothetical protein